MAISKEVWDQAKLLFEYGRSLSEISEQTGINRSTISKKSKTEKWIKNDGKSTLIQQEVHTILMQQEINEKKSTLNQQQLVYHNKQVYKEIERKNVLNMFDNITVQNQMQANKAADEIDTKISQDPGSAIEHLPNIMALSKIAETNRKQIFGVTQAFDVDLEDESKPKIRKYSIEQE